MNRRHFVSTAALAGCCASTALAVQHPLERGGTFENKHFRVTRRLDLFRPVMLRNCDITIDGGFLKIWTRDFAWHGGTVEIVSVPPEECGLHFHPQREQKTEFVFRPPAPDFQSIHIGQIRPHYA